MIHTYISEIKSSAANSEIEAQKIFLSFQSHFFLLNQSIKFEIEKEIADFFNVSISEIKICGSAHIGESPHKETPFEIGVSDLDVAIISTRLFSMYLKISKANSKNLTDRSKFPIDKFGQPTDHEFCRYAATGYFRPDLMPNCPQRATWRTFFGRLSDKYKSSFSSINAGLYLSEELYVDKQISAIDIIKNKGIKIV